MENISNYVYGITATSLDGLHFLIRADSWSPNLPEPETIEHSHGDNMLQELKELKSMLIPKPSAKKRTININRSQKENKRKYKKNLLFLKNVI